MLSVALTGNVAAGKSTVARWFQAWGARLIDADTIVRELQQPGTPVFAALVNRFGPEIVTETGALDRAALRRIVLADPAALDDLNAIVHPAVRARQEELSRATDSGPDAIVVYDIPLLFESADPDRFDLVVLVDAPVPVRRDRLVRLRGLPPGEADRLIAAQRPSPDKRARSDLIIDNDADLATLEARARAAWDRIRARAAARA